MFKVTFQTGEMVLEQDSLPTDDDCLYMLDTGEVDIVIAGSGEAANTNQEERKVGLPQLVLCQLSDGVSLACISKWYCEAWQECAGMACI